MFCQNVCMCSTLCAWGGQKEVFDSLGFIITDAFESARGFWEVNPSPLQE